MREGQQFFFVMYKTFAVLGVVVYQGLEQIEATLKRLPEFNGEFPEWYSHGPKDKLQATVKWLTDDHFDRSLANPSMQQEIHLEEVEVDDEA